MSLFTDAIIRFSTYCSNTLMYLTAILMLGSRPVAFYHCSGIQGFECNSGRKLPKGIEVTEGYIFLLNILFICAVSLTVRVFGKLIRSLANSTKKKIRLITSK